MGIPKHAKAWKEHTIENVFFVKGRTIKALEKLIHRKLFLLENHTLLTKSITFTSLRS
jgi:hypothetical protein